MGDRWPTLTGAARLAEERVARLATVNADGSPHVVPITFTAGPNLIHTPIDHKPKSTKALRRLANIAGEPRVSVIADHYEEDWAGLWWVRADGTASVLDPDTPAHAGAAADLARKYAQYRDVPIEGPIIEIAVVRWSEWSSSSSGGAG